MRLRDSITEWTQRLEIRAESWLRKRREVRDERFKQLIKRYREDQSRYYSAMHEVMKQPIEPYIDGDEMDHDA
jgi:hypothetical protein